MNYMKQTHLVLASAVHSAIVDGTQYVAAPFAMPVLTGQQGAAVLEANAGVMPALEGVAQMLHIDADLGSDSQGLYVLPHLVDAPTLACMLAPEAQAVVAKAMVADARGAQAAQSSRLAAMVPRPCLRTAPLAFVVGAVFTEADGDAPLLLNCQDWWQRSNVRRQCEALLAMQFAQHGVALPAYPLPSPPAQLREALRSGLVEVLMQFRVGEANVSLNLNGPDVVRLTFETPAPGAVISISRALVGEGFVEDMLNSLAPRTDLSEVHARLH